MAETQTSCGFPCGNFTIGKSRLYLGSVMLNYYKKEIKLPPSQVLTQEHVQLPPSFYCKTSGQSHISPVYLRHAFCFPCLVSLPSSPTQRMKHLWELNPGKGSCKSKHPTMSYCFTRDRVTRFKWHRNRLGASVSMTPSSDLLLATHPSLGRRQPLLPSLLDEKIWYLRHHHQCLDFLLYEIIRKKMCNIHSLKDFHTDWNNSSDAHCTLTYVAGVIELSGTWPTLLLRGLHELAKPACNTFQQETRRNRKAAADAWKGWKPQLQHSLWCCFSIQDIHYLILHNNIFPIPTCCCNHRLVHHPITAQSLGKDICEIIHLSSYT